MLEILIILIVLLALIALIRKVGREQIRKNYNITPLHDAAAYGDVEIVKTLLRRYSDANAQTSEGTTPLHVAAHYGNTEIIKTLLMAGADANIQDKYDRTPLDLANENNKLAGTDALKMLNEPPPQPIGSQYFTPLHYARTAELVREYISAGADIEGRDSIVGGTPLHTIASFGNAKTIQELIKKGANIAATDAFGETPLHSAAKDGNTEAVETLLSAGANIEAKTNFDNTPLHLAASKGNAENVIALLRAGANREVRNIGGKTPFDLANEDNKLIGTDALKMLKEPPSQRMGSQYFTPLHYARMEEEVAGNGKVEENIEVKNIMACITPLHAVASNGNAEAIQKFIQKGFNIEAVDKFGETPLHFAAKQDNTETVKILLLAGANIEAKNMFGETPIDLVLKNPNLKGSKVLKMLRWAAQK